MHAMPERRVHRSCALASAENMKHLTAMTSSADHNNGRIEAGKSYMCHFPCFQRWLMIGEDASATSRTRQRSEPPSTPVSSCLPFAARSAVLKLCLWLTCTMLIRRTWRIMLRSCCRDGLHNRSQLFDETKSMLLGSAAFPSRCVLSIMHLMSLLCVPCLLCLRPVLSLRAGGVDVHSDVGCTAHAYARCCRCRYVL